MGVEELKTIRAKIKDESRSWLAVPTSISELSPEVRKGYLGLNMSKEELNNLAELAAQEESLAAKRGFVSVYPSKWDWRKVSGKDWTTPIRDQGACGSCVAFAAVATLESNLEIFKKNPLLNPDLSEADIFFRGCGNCCGSGWNFTPAMRYAKAYGVSDEACYPYDPGDSSVTPCSDRDKRVYKINDWRAIVKDSQAKEWIYTKGPLMTGMEVCDDFFYYGGGVYTYTYGGYAGNHAICVVGYNDDEKYWICKNSWGREWGESGWFKIAYGECHFGAPFGFYTAEFSSNTDIVMPKTGRLFARFTSKGAASDHQIWLHYPNEQLIFMANKGNVGGTFEVGTFSAGTRLILEMKTADGHTYYTDSSLNTDACDHVKKVQLGTYRWELRWEDIYGLGEQDYNDLVMEIEVFDAASDDIVLSSNSRVLVRLKSKKTTVGNEFRLAGPKKALIFKVADASVGNAYDLGMLPAGSRLSFALTTTNGHTYYTDNALNKDSSVHVRKMPTGYNKWELRWEDTYGLKNKDYGDLMVGIEISPITNDDIVLPKAGKVMARFVSRNTNLENEFRLYQPENKSIFVASAANVGKTFEVGSYAAGTRMIFALSTPAASPRYTWYTDSSLNVDAMDHVIKLPLGTTRWQLRWEDLNGLVDRDYNDLAVEISLV